MKFWRYVLACSLIFCSCIAAAGQVSAVSPPSYYAVFLGKWAGTMQRLDGKDRTVNAVEITISLTRKKDRLRMDYVYGKKGDKDFDRATRYLTLNPAKEELISRWEDYGNDRYYTRGLNDFAKTGRGTFIAAAKSFPDGKDRTDICVFTVEDDSFNYNWKMTLDGETFKPESTFSLKRVMQAAGTNPKP